MAISDKNHPFEIIDPSSTEQPPYKRLFLFHETTLLGDRQKGWQFGENLRTQSSGWFPLAYTEIIIDDSLG